MALSSRIRTLYLRRCCMYSTSILSPDSKSPLSSKEKSRAAISLLKIEKNPERILDICRAAALTPESHLDRVAYSTAISKLKDSNYYEGIREFIRDSLARPDFKSERFVKHFIVLFGQAGLIKDAVKLFETGVDMSVKALNSLLFSCVVAREYGEMKRIFSDFPRKYGLQPDCDTYNTVLKGFCESGSSSSAYSLLSEMERNGIKPNAATLSILIAGFYKEEKFSDLDKILDLMKKYGVHSGIGVYNSKIQGLCKLKKSAEAKGLLDEIFSKKMKPNNVTYSHLIHGFCKEGKLDVAKDLFKEMISKNVKPEGVCYYRLIHYLCQGKDFEAALAIYKDSVAKNWVPKIVTMKALVNGLISIEKIDEAKEVIAFVKEKFPAKADKWTEIEEGLSK